MKKIIAFAGSNSKKSINKELATFVAPQDWADSSLRIIEFI